VRGDAGVMEVGVCGFFSEEGGLEGMRKRDRSGVGLGERIQR